MGLVNALGTMPANDSEYLVVCHPNEREWIQPYLAHNQHVIEAPNRGHKLLGPVRPLAVRLRGRIRHSLRRPVATPRSNGFYEALGSNVIHFPHQRFVRSEVSSVYCPWDLQHLHYPEFFKPEDVAWREAVYSQGCRYAKRVLAPSDWVKNDVLEKYKISPDKIEVVMAASPSQIYGRPSPEERTEVKKRHSIPEGFLLYPARTWPHKNHLRLLEALRVLRDLGTDVPLVCTGSPTPHYSAIRARCHDLGISDRVHFLGFVSSNEMCCLYEMAACLVFPSLFEGAGLPILEAFHQALPVACSNATSLPEYGGDAVLLFDPTSVSHLVEAIQSLLENNQLRLDLVRRGTQRLRRFTWEKTAIRHQELYANVARES